MPQSTPVRGSQTARFDSLDGRFEQVGGRHLAAADQVGQPERVELLVVREGGHRRYCFT